MARRSERTDLLNRIQTPVLVEDRTVCNSSGVSIFMAATSREAEDLAFLINTGAETVRNSARPVRMQAAFVPRDGDAAHRSGHRLEDNPFPVDTRDHDLWDSDWEFRHDHCGHSAADAPGGRLDPARKR